MNNRNFINYHVLISHSPSCLNRDDMNMQKTAVFGGKMRVRISSQSLKRSIRKSNYYGEHLGAPSVRTRDLGGLKSKAARLLADRFDEALVRQALEWMSGEEGVNEDTEADAVAPWSVEEIAYFCERIQQGQKDSIDQKKLEKQIEKDAQAFRKALSNTVDIALSGRMATSGLMKNLSVDGALAVAHAITTHTIEPQDVDWFTAVDDLTEDAGETGAGHLNTQQFSAGVFYRYASLNLKQLQVNLGLISNMSSDEKKASRKRTLEIAKHVFHMLATVVPSAKQQSFAAHNLADFAIVSFADQPISLANAFEQPVEVAEHGGYLKTSAERLATYWERINRAYGLNETTGGFSVDDGAALKGAPIFGSLTELESWIEKDGQS